ncbi:hypothetical protein HPB51_007637 [Rhipicephalus microplus]|uniref:Probable RNA polymerase II nuclear localization protein SLC7A6OS n=1 Tax=Rhipicephalus microplus TaxID=6941 RepID=A0A9J6ESH2_RHIMP|nr:probable RNA polymerase II nuclear localization protein SLC7A6OS [Rhipicephalus microplus]KAH8036968.1 hypothetical protein HPB51_007637 [Rhipicephalus microplus]
MTTAVGIKRKADESLTDTIFLARKTAAAADTESDLTQDCTFQYAGSVDTLGDVQASTQQVKKASRHITDSKMHPVDLPSKVRTEQRSASEESRLWLLLQHQRVLEKVRSEEITDENSEAPRESAHRLFRRYDVFNEGNSTDTTENEQAKDGASEVSCNEIPVVRETVEQATADDGNVYDAYFNDLHRHFVGENEFSLFCCGPPDAFARDHDTIYESDTGSDAFDGQDEDDNNAEDDWRNDYPNEEHRFPKDPELDDEFFELFYTNIVNRRRDQLDLSYGDVLLEDDDAPPKQVQGKSIFEKIA